MTVRGEKLKDVLPKPHQTDISREMRNDTLLITHKHKMFNTKLVTCLLLVLATKKKEVSPRNTTKYDRFIKT